MEGCETVFLQNPETYLTILDHYESHHNQDVPLICPVTECGQKVTVQVLVSHLMQHSKLAFQEGKHCKDKSCLKPENSMQYYSPEAFVDHIKSHAAENGAEKDPDSNMFRKYLPTPTLTDGTKLKD